MWLETAHCEIIDWIAAHPDASTQDTHAEWARRRAIMGAHAPTDAALECVPWDELRERPKEVRFRDALSAYVLATCPAPEPLPEVKRCKTCGHELPP